MSGRGDGSAVGDSKPCACRCTASVIRTACSGASDFRRRRFASRACALRWRNANDPVVIAGRRKGSLSPVRQAERDEDDDPTWAASPLAWLDLPPARIRLQRQAQGISL